VLPQLAVNGVESAPGSRRRDWKMKRQMRSGITPQGVGLLMMAQSSMRSRRRREMTSSRAVMLAAGM
jgi:hypothetical protein